METVRFSESRAIFVRAHTAYERLRGELSLLFPGAEFQHVGSTAIPRSLTKGDLDIQIRVSATDFKRAKAILSRRYQSNRGGFWTRTAASFKDDPSDPPIGLHLTVRGCDDDFQWRNRDVLLARADLQRAYNRLKRRFDGKSMDKYREAKEAFFERLKVAPEYKATFGPHNKSFQPTGPSGPGG